MRLARLSLGGVLAGAVCATAGISQASQILAIQFNQTGGADGIQTGFSAFTGSTGTLTSAGQSPYATTDGSGKTVSVGLGAGVGGSGGYFDRGGVTGATAPSNASIYDSFAYENSVSNSNGTASFVLTLTGSDIVAGQQYSLTFYSYDSSAQSGVHVVTFSDTATTSGTTSITYAGGVNPTLTTDDTATKIFTADSTGTLTINVSDAFTGASDFTGARLNAFVLSSVPEPACLSILAASSCFLLPRRRRETAAATRFRPIA